MRRLIASWFGTGLVLRRLRGSDAGSGTAASLLALPLALALGLAGWGAQLIGTLLVAGLAVWSARPFAVEGADPGWVVADEAAGTFLAVIGLRGWPVVVAFSVFRIADISKRLPGVAAAERFPGSVGITADDLVAGLWALAAGWVVTPLIG